jgi:hypothetical protein
VEASGHLYSDDLSKLKQTVFAAEVMVVKRMSAQKKEGEDSAAR